MKKRLMNEGYSEKDLEEVEKWAEEEVKRAEKFAESDGVLPFSALFDLV